MTRGLDTNQSNAVKAGHVAGVAFVELDFAVTLRLCTLPYAATWNGQTWMGVGSLGDISQIAENTNLQAAGVSLTLSGIDPTMISSALSEQYQGKAAKIWYCMIDPDTAQLIGTPLPVFTGRIDTMTIEVGATAAITLSAESKLIDFFRQRVTRFTSADQQAKYPGDGGLDYVAQMLDKTITWGRA
jgi:hypothetical protein